MVLIGIMKKIVCPKCENSMSLFTFAQSPTPWHLKCGSCKTKLKPRKHSVLIVTLAGIFGLAIALAYGALKLAPLYFLIVLIFEIIVFETLAFYACRLIGLDLEIRS
jgi:hypothetical protein